jgi:hypothetical protein
MASTRRSGGGEDAANYPDSRRAAGGQHFLGADAVQGHLEVRAGTAALGIGSRQSLADTEVGGGQFEAQNIRGR